MFGRKLAWSRMLSTMRLWSKGVKLCRARNPGPFAATRDPGYREGCSGLFGREAFECEKRFGVFSLPMSRGEPRRWYKARRGRGLILILCPAGIPIQNDFRKHFPSFIPAMCRLVSLVFLAIEVESSYQHFPSVQAT